MKRNVLDVVEERVDGTVPRLAHSVDAVAGRRWRCTAVAAQEGAEADTDFREQLEETHDDELEVVRVESIRVYESICKVK